MTCTLGAPAFVTLPQQLHKCLPRSPAMVRDHHNSTVPRQHNPQVVSYITLVLLSSLLMSHRWLADMCP